MIRAKEARQEAREALNGKWKKAFLISLVYMIFTMLIGLLGALLGPLSFLVSIAEIVILPPLTYGMAYSYYHLKNGEEVSYFDFLKAGFDNFGRSWGIAWRIFCKCWYLILIPIILMVVLLGIGLSIYSATSSTLSKNTKQEQYLKASYSATPYTDYYDYYDSYYDYLDDYYDNYDYNYDYNYNYDNDYDYNYKGSKDSSISSSEVSKAFSAIVGASAGIMLLAIGLFAVYIVILVFVIRKLLLYALSYYIAVANEGMTPKDAVQESENLMKGNRGRLFCLMLSFIGWAFLVGLVGGVLSIVPTIGWLFEFIASAVGTSLLTPYMTFAILAFYKDLKGGNINNQPNQNGPVIGGYNNQSINNGYQVNTNQEMNNGYQANMNPGMNNNYNANPNIVEPNAPATNNQSGKKYCKRCGAENTQDATYCTNCGAKLD